MIDALTSRGFKVFPIKAGSKYPPLWKDWPNRSSTTIPMDWPIGANVGIHCAGLLVVDVDPRNGGDGSLLALELDNDLPLTLTAITASGGRHLFYSLPEGHPGVRNSAGVLGAGLDVKSTRGYVVGVGSRTEKGEYRWQDPDTPIAAAPEWLVQRCGVFTEREQAVKVNVPDADPATVERAAAWLTARPGAAEGQGGDAYTFATAAFLRDFGLSEAQTLTLLLEGWNARCSPPWDPSELGVKIKNAYAYGTGTPGAKAVTADDFPTVEPNVGTSVQAPTSPVAPRAGAVRLADFATRRVDGPGYLVKGLLSKASYAELYGPPGSGKTFMALDIAYHVAAGSLWMDRKVRQGTVLYLAYEGTGGLVKRAQALRRKYGDADVALYIMPAAYNLREQSGRQALAFVLAALPEKPTLVVIDTFARALMGGDENSAQDVGAFNNAVQALIESTGACALILHHTGKDVKRGARGSSALQGAVDTEIAVDGRALMPTKQRDIELGGAIGFKLTPMVVGLDEDDDDVTSCVVDAAAIAAETGGVRLEGNQQRGWDVLVRTSPNNEPISLDEWRDACAEFLGARGRKGFYDIRTRLEARGLIVVENGLVTRRME